MKYQPQYNEGIVNNRMLYTHYLHQATAPAGQLLNVEGWNYLDILTNGNFNPYNNYGTEGILHPNSRCYIEFNDGDKYLINADILNLPLIKKSFLRFHNRLGLGQPANDALETGYNEIVFILKNFNSQSYIDKENPNYCEKIVIAAGATTIWWFGIKRLLLAYYSAIGWLPYGYEKIGILFETDAVSYVADWYQHHCDTNYKHLTNLNKGCNHINCCSRQHSLLLNNRDGVNRTFNFNIHFLNKSDM